MNNEKFRRLVLANSAQSPGQGGQSRAPPPPPSAQRPALGSRQKASIPMTPRSVVGPDRVDFARQLAERNKPERAQKRFRSSAPRGSRFAEGYVDRARQRLLEQEKVEKEDKEEEKGDDDDKAARIKALEESLKEGVIDQATFEKLRDEIAGGDLSSTHLIKGLDFKLLARVRKGEDVFAENRAGRGGSGGGVEAVSSTTEVEGQDLVSGQDVDDALEQLEAKEVAAVVKDKAKKKGQLATRRLVPGQKRTRDQILAEMKAAREAAQAKKEPALGSRFKKIGTRKQPGTRIERDGKGREVLIIVDEDGNERRKVRKVAAEVELEREAFKLGPDAVVLGMQVPEFYKKKLEEQARQEDKVTMFSDVESDYDPLQGIQSDAEGSDDDEPEDAGQATDQPARSKGEAETASPPAGRAMGAMQLVPKAQAQEAPKYFPSGLISEERERQSAMMDASVLAALQKARTLKAAARSEQEQKDLERQEKLKAMLASADRDAEDLDLDFGMNRVEDEEEDGEEPGGGKAKMCRWGGGEEKDDGRHGGTGKSSKRKRGPKKRKEDGNKVADVMRILEKRKAGGS